MALARGKHFIWINAALLSSNFKPGRELWWIRRVSIIRRQNANFTWMLATWERREQAEGVAWERRRRAAPRAGWCTAPGRWKMELVTDSIMSLVLLKYMITQWEGMSVFLPLSIVRLRQHRRWWKLPGHQQGWSSVSCHSGVSCMEWVKVGHMQKKMHVFNISPVDSHFGEKANCTMLISTL